jgi:hypothetical protein
MPNRVPNGSVAKTGVSRHPLGLPCGTDENHVQNVRQALSDYHVVRQQGSCLFSKYSTVPQHHVAIMRPSATAEAIVCPPAWARLALRGAEIVPVSSALAAPDRLLQVPNVIAR